MLMLRIFKWFLGLLFSVAVLLAVAIIVVPRVVDPNDYRDQVAQLVQDKTGVEIQLNGDLSVSVFPWLGIRTENLRVLQPAEIGGELLQVDSAQMRVKLLPLFNRQVEIDTIVLQQPQLRLVTLQGGVNSLSKLIDGASANDKDRQQPIGNKPAEAALVMAVQGLELSNGRLEWDDRQAKQHYLLDEFQLSTGDLLGDELTAVTFSGNLIDLSKHGISNQVSVQTAAIKSEAMKLQFSTQLRIDTQEKRAIAVDTVADIQFGQHRVQAEMNDINIDVNNSSVVVDASKIDLSTQLAQKELIASSLISALNFDLDSSQLAINTLVTDVDYDGQEAVLNIPNMTVNSFKQTANIASAELVADDLNIAFSDLSITDYVDDLNARGSLDIAEFDAAKMLQRFEIDYVATDPQALKKSALQANFIAGLDKVSLSDIQFDLDDTKLKGDFSATNFATATAPNLEFDLSLDQLNLDRYLPESESVAVTESNEQSDAAQALVVPMALFKQLNANGRFKADTLISSGVELSHIDVVVESTPGNVSITPKADLYDGQLAGTMMFTEREDVSQLRIQNSIGLVDLAKFLSAADVTEQLTGLGTIELDVLVSERDGVQSNTGTIKLFAKDGAIQGLDVKDIIDKGYAVYQQLAGKSSEDDAALQGQSQASDATGFAELLGTFDLKNSRLSSRSFQLNAPFFRIAGSGDIDLAALSLDYLLNVSIVQTTSGQGGEALDELAGFTLPIALRGSVLAPKYTLDKDALYQALAKQKVDDKRSEYLEQKYDIENAEELSTKDVLRELLIREVIDDDEKIDENQIDAETVESESNTIETDEASSETQEPPPEPTKKQLRDERKRKLIEGLFD